MTLRVACSLSLEGKPHRDPPEKERGELLDYGTFSTEVSMSDDFIPHDFDEAMAAVKDDALRKGESTDTTPDWSRCCENCDAKPVVPQTGLCGPCTFGEAETAGGNW